MLTRIFERCGASEIWFRKAATSLKPLKKRIRKYIREKRRPEIATERNERQIELFIDALKNCGICKNDIVIIHSSYDGLRCLGLSAEEILKIILDIFSDTTIVFATFPIEPLRMKEIYKYDPHRTICWTGIIPNLFLKQPMVVRSSYPYNTLGALGKEAEVMMADNIKSIRPHDEFSAWEYCRRRHAKILFIGTSSRESNTMAIHMVPDILGNTWPIANWYEERKYQIKLENETILKNVEVQSGFWYRYVNEFKTDKALKDNGLLLDISRESIKIEIVPDSAMMLNYLVEQCSKNDLMYRIPNRYYKR